MSFLTTIYLLIHLIHLLANCYAIFLCSLDARDIDDNLNGQLTAIVYFSQQAELHKNGAAIMLIVH